MVPFWRDLVVENGVEMFLLFFVISDLVTSAGLMGDREIWFRVRYLFLLMRRRFVHCACFSAKICLSVSAEIWCLYVVVLELRADAGICFGETLPFYACARFGERIV
ncbi:hypothetical protein F511_28237 [Dorcoceras hygrometricum]|uniref:Uncharacterized protein n=1 Tax=Dorcoceras hygrometricum TaxID=472368 RepID=A0A2Z7D2U8_9LAMI|nr:hypothetical protein F511_28237 [Dorcoceras hygrometricum]